MNIYPKIFIDFLSRRMKRWVMEKQQREKNIPRRHRHKSLGDVETTSKSKRQQQLIPQSVQVIDNLDLF